ncbi:hypothetical protein [Microbacterium aerolatum]|uniref:hypothetical protein n=1 Tax=Microbacterium aerolatum TaxID=153731 RepID=UPI0038503EAE
MRPGVDPTWAAMATIAFMDGLQVQWLLDRSVVDMATALEVFLDGLVTGLHRGDQDGHPLAPHGLNHAGNGAADVAEGIVTAALPQPPLPA